MRTIQKNLKLFILCLFAVVFFGMTVISQKCAAENRTADLSKEEMLDKYKVETCIVTVEIDWDSGRGWQFRNDFFLKYLKQIRSLYRDDTIIKHVDFSEFREVTILMLRNYCHAKGYEVLGSIFNSVQGSKDHPAMIRKMSAVEGYFNSVDPRGVSGGIFPDDYIRTLDKKILKKCLFVAELTNMKFGYDSEDVTWYFSDLLRIYREYAFPFIDVHPSLNRVNPELGEDDHKGDAFFLLSGDCQNGMKTINNFLYWTSHLAKGKMKKTTFKFIKNPDLQYYLDKLSH